MRITIATIPHAQQRYDTLGDWFWVSEPEETLHIRVSEPLTERHTFAIALHELVEALLCRIDHIPQQAVDDWDTAFGGDGEPGEDPGCPYYEQHAVANAVELIFARCAGLTWRGHLTSFDDNIHDDGDE